MEKNKTIGALIEIEARKNKKSITQLAKELSCSRQNVYDIFQKNCIDIQRLKQISVVLNHNFFEDLAKDEKLANIPKKVKTILIKDLRDWLVDFIYNTINELQIEDNKEFNEWVNSFERQEAECLVDMEFIVDWKYDGVEDDEEVSQEAATEYAMKQVQHILDKWYIKPWVNEIFLEDKHIETIMSEFAKFPKFPPNVIIDSLDFFHMSLQEMPEEELRNQTIKREFPIYLNEWPLLFGEIYLTFDNELNIVDFKFDRTNSVI